MKKSETLERTRNAKVKFLEKYFEYHKDKELIIRQLSDEMESHSTCDSFKKHVIALHGVTPCGKNTVLFWMERGYSADESDELVKPYKVKRDASRSPMNIDYWKNKGYTEEESMYMIKSQRKTNVEYWLSRGFDVVAANAAMSEFQKQQACSYAALRKARPDKYRLSNSLTVDYWIDKGYDTDAAKQMLAERQSTFSKQKYNGMRNKNYDKKKTLLSNNSINNVHYSDNLTDIKEFIQNLT